ncbi:MAG: 16S rRNA (adenine(1518)-N(6)/adenine(1519)-N(6))-dimethyltransferase RsmA [Nanoarchaeota archaeon]|nr:ribosomal RNA small subunit methyltransferase A [Nanoarchaeota archaeon]MBU4299814.1 ribosomal RNA small subunit methyltransferase A [Nanoarchaeota archaeon]MBU4451283.1 ribosomal RNA small subunit methyltransferase A [Nanoarchaeota archaeon]MCG2723572.1 16S rRNA (adenine(1518)-N(6)/adenine(1519)-N(6))-dimethyltransferase RsmA [archaeon]
MIFLKTTDILEKYGIAPNPDADQHFMIDEKMLKKIVSAAKLKKGDVVLEIGAGVGNLTKLLAEKAKKVYAIEKDNALSSTLKKETAEFGNIEIIIADALKVKLPQFDKLVSNLPYQICEALLQRLIFTDFALAVICVPEKFAERILAKSNDKNYSILSIKSQIFFDIKLIAEVPRNCFFPVPRVNSKVVSIAPKKKPGFFGYFLQEFLREDDKIAKNAMREAVIFASKRTGAKEILTKRSAKEIVEKLKLVPETLEKRVSSLNRNDVSSIIECVKKACNNY